jgi:hypothetical protein
MATNTSPTTAPNASPRPVVSRRLALLIAAAAVAILALGWLADALLTLAPGPTFSNGQTQQAGLYRVALTFDPAVPRAGVPEHAQVRVSDVSGQPVSGADVRLSLTMPAMVMVPLQVSATPSPDGAHGVYVAQSTFPMAGTWSAAVRITPKGQAAVQTEFVVSVR